jgi:hypothetical protein
VERAKDAGAILDRNERECDGIPQLEERISSRARGLGAPLCNAMAAKTTNERSENPALGDSFLDVDADAMLAPRASPSAREWIIRPNVISFGSFRSGCPTRNISSPDLQVANLPFSRAMTSASMSSSRSSPAIDVVVVGDSGRESDMLLWTKCGPLRDVALGRDWEVEKWAAACSIMSIRVKPDSKARAILRVGGSEWITGVSLARD